MLLICVSGYLTYDCYVKHIQNKLARSYASQASSLKERFAQLIPEVQEDTKKTVAELGDKKLGDNTVGQLYGGMRGLKALL